PRIGDRCGHDDLLAQVLVRVGARGRGDDEEPDDHDERRPHDAASATETWPASHSRTSFHPSPCMRQPSARAPKPLWVTVMRVPAPVASSSMRTSVCWKSSQLRSHVYSSTRGGSTTRYSPRTVVSRSSFRLRAAALHRPPGRRSTRQSDVWYVSADPHHAASSRGSVSARNTASGGAWISIRA